MLATGARVLVAVPTGSLASGMRAVHPEVEVDTCAGAFLFHRELSEALPILTQYDLVVIDEVAMLSEDNMDRITAMWKAANRLPCLVLSGDLWQMPGPHKPPSKITDSAGWKHVHIIDFNTVYRCKDKVLQKKLSALRTSVPSKRLLKKISDHQHRAWRTKEPTAWDIQQLFRQHRDTTIATCTKKGAATVNRLAVEVLFKNVNKPSLGRIPMDWELNTNNFQEDGKRKEGEAPEPMWMEVYKGMRLSLTKNFDKRGDFVNGMTATVDYYDDETKCLGVTTATGKQLAVHLYSEGVENSGRVTCFPVRLGYAGTVQRIQGMTLNHITLFLDRAGCRAAGYVALSRVAYDKDYLIAGPVTPRHFVPAM